MSRYSPTQGPGGYGPSLADMLDRLSRQEYYEFAREQEAARAAEREQDRQIEMMILGETYPNLTYSPSGAPGQRTYADPVLGDPQPPARVDSHALKYAPGAGLRIPEETLGGDLMEAQRAEAGKPVALAGELLPGGGGFASRNVYRTVDTGQYQEVAPNLYRDQFYDPEMGMDEARERALALGLTPEAAEMYAHDPSFIHSMPEDRLFPEKTFAQRAREAVEAEMIGEAGTRRSRAREEELAELEHTRAMELAGARRSQTGASGRTPIPSQDPSRLHALEIFRQYDGEPSDEELRINGYPTRRAWLADLRQEQPQTQGQA
ncbi:MAG: hypothetical protein JSW25_07795, partial [Thermoplasmata archaeon]